MKKTVLSILVIALVLVIDPCAYARGRGGRGGGGGAARAGGMSRPAVHAPSMSRANMSRPSMPTARPSTMRPSMPTTRPNIPTSRPNIPNTRPSMPTTRPGMPNTRPSMPSTRPNVPGNRLPDNRPNMPSARPNLPSNGINRFPSQGARPGFPSNGQFGGARPNPNELKDFLDLPGQNFNRPSTLPSTRPDLPNLPQTRPSLPENRPNLPENRPNLPEGAPGRPETRPAVPDRRPEGRPGNNVISNRPNVEGGDRIRNLAQGGHNVSVGDVNVNIRNNNLNNVRNKWTNVNNRPFDRNWWVDPGFSRNPAYWRWHTSWGRYPRYWCWRPCSWVAYGTWFTWRWTQPVSYNYGTTVVYRDNYVYLNDQQVGTAEEYYTQAETLASEIPQDVEPEQVEWMPLGVFAVTDANGNDTSMLLQLAVSKEGIIAGTFNNTTTGKSKPVEGMVDRETQRAAWHFADQPDSTIVMEAGIYDLTKDQTSALLHFDESNSQNWLLVRLPEPEGAE